MKKLIFRIKEALNVFRKGYTGSFFTSVGVVLNKFSDYKTYLNSVKKVSAVYHSCDIISNYSKNAWLALANAKGERIELDECPDVLVKRMIRQPNPHMDQDAFKSNYVFDILLAGNVFWALDGIDSKGRPTEIYRLYPNAVEIIPDPVKKIKEYRYTPPGSGTSIVYPADRVIHIKYNPDPEDEYWGLGIIGGNEDLFNHSIDLCAFRKNFLKNGANPSGIFSTDQALVPQQRNQLEADLKSKTTGAGNAGNPVLLSHGMKFQQTGLSPMQLKTLDEHILTAREVFMLFKIPPFLRNLAAEDNPKYDNLYYQKQEFMINMIAPILKLYETAYNKALAYINLEFKMSHDDVTDTFSVENLLTMVEKSLVSPNEFRALVGLAPRREAFMNEVWGNVQMIPLSDLVGLGNPNLTAPGGKPPAGQASAHLNQAKTIRAQRAQLMASPTQRTNPPMQVSRSEGVPEAKVKDPAEPAAQPAPISAPIPRSIPRPISWRDTHAGGWRSIPPAGGWTLKDFSREETVRNIQLDFLRLARASVTRWMQRAQNNYAGFLQGQSKRILKRLEDIPESAFKSHEHYGVGLGTKARNKTPAQIAAEIFQKNEENRILAEISKPMYQAMADKSSEDVAHILSITLTPGASQDIIDRINLTRARGPRINDTQREKLQAILEEGMSEGLTKGEMAVKIQSELDMFNSARPATIARNELAEAYRQGARAGMVDSGVITEISVVGCEAEEPGSPTYKGRSTCNIDGVPIEDIDKLDYHVNHTGAEVPSKFASEGE